MNNKNMDPNQNKTKLAVGPMSSEVIEGVFRHSHLRRTPLFLIASKNQIDHSGGYVNRWKTRDYMDFVKSMREMYPDSKVKVCRDHCGPGFNGKDDLGDVYQTIEDDIKNGFDLIHIDFCHFRGHREERLTESKKAIEFCQKLKPDIQLEVGTDENTGANYNLSNLDEIAEELDYFQDFCQPEFFVVQTGSLVKEIGQAGTYNEAFVRDVANLLRERGLKLKEHNADYLIKEEIIRRQGVVDCMNNAPQFGVAQTTAILAKCLIYGIDTKKYLDLVYEQGKWRKWLEHNTPENKELCFLIAGHYHFNSDEYKKIIEQLAENEDIKETLIDVAMNIIDHYTQ